MTRCERCGRASADLQYLRDEDEYWCLACIDGREPAATQVQATIRSLQGSSHKRKVKPSMPKMPWETK